MVMKEEDDKLKKEEVVVDPFQPKGPRDGYDNTGTQGYDSLKDDGYTGSTEMDTEGKQDGTGSSSKDFPDSHT